MNNVRRRRQEISFVRFQICTLAVVFSRVHAKIKLERFIFYNKIKQPTVQILDIILPCSHNGSNLSCVLQEVGLTFMENIFRHKISSI